MKGRSAQKGGWDCYASVSVSQRPIVPWALWAVQLFYGRTPTHTKSMGRGFANPSLVCTLTGVKQTGDILEQVKPISYVNENVSERMIMDNRSSKRSTSVSFPDQCSFQHLSWNNLRWVDELDTKVDGDIWEKVESLGRATMEVGTTRDSEVLEMDVMCQTWSWHGKHWVQGWKLILSLFVILYKSFIHCHLHQDQSNQCEEQCISTLL